MSRGREAAADAEASALGARHWAWFIVIAVLVIAWRWITRESLHLNLHFDEAQYVLWSREPAFGYFSKPPLVAWAIGGARALCGESEFCVRLPAALAVLGTAAMVMLLAHRLVGAAAALPAALLFLLAPLNAVLASFMTTDALLLLCWSMALYAYMRALQTDSRRWWVATGLAAGAGLLAKYSMGIFALSAALFLLGDRRHRGRLLSAAPWLGAAVAALLFAPNVAWNVGHQFATLGHTAEISALDRASFGAAAAQRLAIFVGEQIAVFGPLAAVALAAAWWAAARAVRAARAALATTAGLPAAASVSVSASASDSGSPSALPLTWTQRDAQRLLLWGSLPFFAVIALQATAARAHANWAAPTFVAGAILAAGWLVGRRRWLVAALALDVLLTLVAFHARPLAQLAGYTLGRRDPLVRLQGWDRLGAALAAAVEAQPAGTRVVTDERALVVLFSFYARPQADGLRVWNPSRVINNHFRMTRDVIDTPEGPFLIASEQAGSEAALMRDFADVSALPPLHAGGRTLYLWRAASFSGYRP